MTEHTLKLLDTLTESLVIKGWLGSEVNTDVTYTVISAQETEAPSDRYRLKSEHNFTIDEITVNGRSLNIHKTNGKDSSSVTMDQAIYGVQIARSSEKASGQTYVYTTIFKLTSITDDTMSFSLSRTTDAFGDTSTDSNLECTATRKA